MPRAEPLLLLVLAFGCEREARRFEDEQPVAPPDRGAYGSNAWAMAEGARLYSQMNCVGCHGHGGGGMGPPLRDGAWRYGARGADVFASIMDGRPNGMPAFRARLSEQQGWQLAAYVRSLSGLQTRSAAPGREDHMQAGTPPARQPPLAPVGETP